MEIHPACQYPGELVDTGRRTNNLPSTGRGNNFAKCPLPTNGPLPEAFFQPPVLPGSTIKKRIQKLISVSFAQSSSMSKIKAGKSTSKKDVIIKKAAALFRTKGFAAASMRELAVAVGVEAPSLYNHIGSKAELLQVICFAVAEKFTAQLNTALNSKENTAAKTESIIRFYINMMMTEFDEVFVANHEWKHLPEPFLSDFLLQRRNYEKKMAGLIEEGIKKKELKKLDPYVAVLTLLSAVRGLEFWQRHKKNSSTAMIADNMVNHLLNGLKK